FFFFSSRRRHTRFSRDWSSDVCSSDLKSTSNVQPRSNRCPLTSETVSPTNVGASPETAIVAALAGRSLALVGMMGAGKSTIGRRSEERRVGKEWRTGGGRWQEQRKNTI